MRHVVILLTLLLPSFGAADSASKCRLETSTQCTRGSVATSRAGPAWCERYDGQAVQLGAGQACLTADGLEAGAAATVVSTNGNALDLWSASGGALVQRAAGGYWRIADESTTTQATVSQTVSAGTVGAAHTLSCLARAGTTDRATLMIGGASQACQVTLPRDGRFHRVSCTKTLATTARTPAVLVGWDASDTGTVEVRGCQLEAAARPGRICYSGSCLPDVHTYSASDWPRTKGSIALRVAGVTSGAQYLFDDGLESFAFITGGVLTTSGLAGQTVATGVLDWSGGPYRLTWTLDGATLTVRRDGAVVASGAFAGFPMSSTVTLGGGGLFVKALDAVRLDDDTFTCLPVPGVGLRCTDGRVSSTVRAAPAIPCGGGTAAVNVACVTGGAMQAYGAGAVRPGCDGTCKADVHTISTAGFPTTVGRVRAVFQTSAVLGVNQMVVDGRTALGAGVVIHVASTGVVRVAADGTSLQGGTVTAGVDNVVEVVRAASGTGQLFLNGVQVATGPLSAFAWKATGVVGSNLNLGGGDPLQGSVRSVSWSAK